jgi:SAM-dependent methyltransferase
LSQAIIASVRYRGVGGTVRRFVSLLPGLNGDKLTPAEEFDARYGVDTAGRIEVEDAGGIGDSKAFAVHYEGTHAPSFLQAIASLKLRYQDFTFVDFGCGKGLAMLLASWFSFKRVRGVEFSPELHEVCESNIHSFNSDKQKCADIEAFCADATEFEIPAGPGVYYFFNPFQAPIMRKVLHNIEASYRASPREMYVIYFNPQAPETLAEAGFEQVGETAGHRIYEKAP